METLSTEILLAQPATNVRRVLRLFLLLNICTFVLTIIPFALDLGSWDSRGWFTGDDFVRLLEPLVALPLMFLIFMESPQAHLRSNLTNLMGDYTIGVLFMLGCAIYQQGAGYHSASALFKKPVKQLRNQFEIDSDLYQTTDRIYSWIRDDWEHVISHYLYAAGGLFTSFIYAFIYRHVSLAEGIRGPMDKAVYMSASAFYGLIIGAIAINFPKGSIVALVLVVVYGFGIIGYFLFKKKCILQWGTYPILQYYFNAYVLAFVIIVGWMSSNGLKNLSGN